MAFEMMGKGEKDFSAKFRQALVNGDLEMLRQIPKGDRHIHASRGCARRAFPLELQDRLVVPPANGFGSLEQMQKWFDDHISPHFRGIDGWLAKIDGMFRSACADGVVYVEPNFTLRDLEKFGSLGEFWRQIHGIYEKYAQFVVFSPCLSIRTRDDLDFTVPRVKKALDYGGFRAIDLCNQEGVRPYSAYRATYDCAAYYGVRRKAHVGEFGTAEDVMEAITQLDLNEVQHGIAVVNSAEAMALAVDKGTHFHVCPASNIALHRAADYGSHPIKVMVENGLHVTIGTDDLLVFDATVTQQYLRLYQSGCLNVEQLDQIRINSLAVR